MTGTLSREARQVSSAMVVDPRGGPIPLIEIKRDKALASEVVGQGRDLLGFKDTYGTA